MSKSLLFPTVLVIVVTLVSAAYAYFRASVLATSDQIATKGLEAASRDTAVLYALVSVGVGVIGYFAFRAMFNSSPDTVQSNFLLLALGIGIMLEVMGLVVFKMRGIMDLTVLHVVHILGYGWLLPQLLLRG